MIKNIAVVWRIYNGSIPVKTVFHILWLQALVLYGRHHNSFTFFCFLVMHFYCSLVAATHGISRVIRVKSNKSTFASGGKCPVSVTDISPGKITAGYHYRTVILLAAVNIIRKTVVCIYPVKLCCRLVVLC